MPIGWARRGSRRASDSTMMLKGLAVPKCPRGPSASSSCRRQQAHQRNPPREYPGRCRWSARSWRSTEISTSPRSASISSRKSLAFASSRHRGLANARERQAGRRAVFRVSRCPRCSAGPRVRGEMAEDFRPQKRRSWPMLPWVRFSLWPPEDSWPSGRPNLPSGSDPLQARHSGHLHTVLSNQRT